MSYENAKRVNVDIVNVQLYKNGNFRIKYLEKYRSVNLYDIIVGIKNRDELKELYIAATYSFVKYYDEFLQNMTNIYEDNTLSDVLGSVFEEDIDLLNIIDLHQHIYNMLWSKEFSSEYNNILKCYDSISLETKSFEPSLIKAIYCCYLIVEVLKLDSYNYINMSLDHVSLETISDFPASKYLDEYLRVLGPNEMFNPNSKHYDRYLRIHNKN